MSTAEMLFLKRRSTCPENLQTEALHYVDFLLTRRATDQENKEWSKFSAEPQLATSVFAGRRPSMMMNNPA